MSMMASQITSLTIVYSTVYSGADQRKHQSSTSLAFVQGIHRWPVNSLHKGKVTWKMFPFDDIIMLTIWWLLHVLLCYITLFFTRNSPESLVYGFWMNFQSCSSFLFIKSNNTMETPTRVIWKTRQSLFDFYAILDMRYLSSLMCLWRCVLTLINIIPAEALAVVGYLLWTSSKIFSNIL